MRNHNSTIRSWWQAPRLDDRIARGEDPASDPALARRAERLTAAGERSALAAALDAVIADAERGPTRFSVRVQPRRRAVRECTGDLLSLAARLRDGEPVDAQGVAMVAVLVRDGASPLFYSGAPRTLTHTVRSARHALDPVEPAEPIAA
jgi:hypothetical protein